MIVWSGRGFLSVIVLLLSFAIFAGVFTNELADYAFVSAFFIAGIFSWFMGNKWNNKEGKTFIDKESGQEVVLKPNHSLFWIKMQYWGLIFGIFGLIILMQNII